MSCRSPQDAELEAILGRFSSFIKMHLLKFNPAKHGLDIDDLFQEVKIKIWKLLGHKKDIGNLTSYIKKGNYAFAKPRDGLTFFGLPPVRTASKTFSNESG